MQCSGSDFKLKQIETFSLKMLIPIILSAENTHYGLSFFFTLPHNAGRHMARILEWSYEENVLTPLTGIYFEGFL